MDLNNFNNAKAYILGQRKFIDFIDGAVSSIRQKCNSNVPFLQISEWYIEMLSKLNLSRLESFILILEIKNSFESRGEDLIPCVDSFIDDICTRHTGNYPIDGVIRFKNEPDDLASLRNYISTELWMATTSWKDRFGQ